MTFPCFRFSNKPCPENESCCLVTDLFSLKQAVHQVLDRNKATREEKALADHLMNGIAAHIVQMDNLVETLQERVNCWREEHTGCCGGIMNSCQEFGCDVVKPATSMEGKTQ